MYHKAYGLDSDGNILHTRCEMIIERGRGAEKEIKTILESELPSYFNKGRNYLNESFKAAAHHMRVGKGKYAQNLLEAFEAKAYWPIWKTFQKINVQASPTAIITARGHDAEEIKAGHRTLFHETLSEAQKEEFFENMQHRLWHVVSNTNTLLQNYLDMNYYAPCSNEAYSATLGVPFDTPIPQKKVLAFHKFIEHIISLNQKKLMNPHRKALKIWFSDDSLENLSAIEEAIQNRFVLSYPEITFALYNTNNPAFVKKTLYASKQNQEPEF